MPGCVVAESQVHDFIDGLDVAPEAGVHFHQADYILGEYQQAIDAFEQGLESNPSSERMRVWLAAS
jgi:hypothetical protein